MSRRYTLLSSLDAHLLGFSLICDLYATCEDFKHIYDECVSKGSVNHYFIEKGYLFKSAKLCIPRSSIRLLLVQESHCGGLMGHFGIDKTLAMLKEHFYWPKMKKRCR